MDTQQQATSILSNANAPTQGTGPSHNSIQKQAASFQQQQSPPPQHPPPQHAPPPLQQTKTQQHLQPQHNHQEKKKMQQVQLPQQQHMPHQGLNGGWQSDRDVNDRRQMIARIVQLLQQRKPNAPDDWLKKLPQMAKRLEESLYRSAPSFQAYNDVNTLKQRLQQLALNIGMKTKKLKQAQAMQNQQYQAQQQQQQPQRTPQQTATAVHQPQQRTAPQQQQTPLQQPKIQLQPQPQRQMVNMSDINPIMGGASVHPQGSSNSQAIPNTDSSSAYGAPLPSTNLGPQTSVSIGDAQNNSSRQHAQQAGVQSAHPALTKIGGSGTTQQGNKVTGFNAGSSSRPGSDRQQVLRHQQQRLLLLRHAAKCPHEHGKCPVTPHCAGMKRLWKHIAECKDQKCLVPHCVSSRYVLSHYHRCKDAGCPVCGPVREAIHRSHEKQRQIQDLKRRHESAVQSQLPAAPVSSANLQQNKQKEKQTVPGQKVIAQPALAPTSIAPAPVPLAPTSDSQQGPLAKRMKLANNTDVSTARLQVDTSTKATPQQECILQQGKQQEVGNPASHNKPREQPASQTSNAAVVQPTTHTSGGYVYSRPSQSSSAISGSSTSGPSAAGKYPNGQAATPITTQVVGPKPQEDHTLINCFTIEQIETHIKSLNRGLQLAPQQLKIKCLEVLKILQLHQHGWVFNSPVDPVELGLPDYFQVIKRPMDLGTIKKRLENGCYHSLEEFEADVNQTFDNAMHYNPEGSVVYNMANEMKSKFLIDYRKLIQEINAEEDVKRQKGDACALCGSEKLLFEPPVFYCNGMNCPSKRIRRNSYYYVAGNNQYHWCHLCFGDLNDSIEMIDMTLEKSKLTKKKNDEIHEESWVQCDKCERWIHQICGLFNTRQNKSADSEYVCPGCTIAKRKEKGVTDGTSSTAMAEDLPRTKLSEHIEEQVQEKVHEYLERTVNEKAEAEKISVEEARREINAGKIAIRLVTSMDRKLEVRERMHRRYSFKKYPSEFTFRCKCMVVFQNLDGVDVILFGLYVYEHDEKNPPPNTRAIYISYLDSVHFMKPRKMRTFVYHEIMIAYLEFVRRKGFSTVHIWACPPLKGDDYILYAKPEDQKTPRDDRLRQWYLDMLIEGQKRGIVGKLTNMYDVYFANPKNDATVVPYMDGDYFPAEVENIIKDLEEGKSSKKASSTGKKKKGTKSKNKNKSGRGGTRSSGIDEEALSASSIVPTGVTQKSLEEGGRDFVMAKLGETIRPMKESFIVAYLNWDGARAEDMVVPKDIAEYREKNGIVAPQKIPCGKEKIEKETLSKITEGVVAVELSRDGSITENKKSGGSSSPSEQQNLLTDQENAKEEVKPPETLSADEASSHPTPNGVYSTKKLESVESSERSKNSNQQGAEVKGDDEEKNQKVNVSSPTPQEIKSSATEENLDKKTKVLDDDKEEMDCEFLNNRQAFLNLCQGNHYQFDHLRRAKHSSMMVLWHLHNRDAPAFVQQCAVCSREILTGYRYHCPICANYDQCNECVSNPQTPRHIHQLKAIPVEPGKRNELTEGQRKERQRSIQLHMTLLLHAAICSSTKCPSANCAKMKGLLKHGASCQVKATGGCHVCKRIWALLQIHARQCKQSPCPVPNCMAIRERFRQLTMQQQAMDDRRRQEMNRVYRASR